MIKKMLKKDYDPVELSPNAEFKDVFSFTVEYSLKSSKNCSKICSKICSKSLLKNARKNKNYDPIELSPNLVAEVELSFRAGDIILFL